MTLNVPSLRLSVLQTVLNIKLQIVAVFRKQSSNRRGEIRAEENPRKQYSVSEEVLKYLCKLILWWWSQLDLYMFVVAIKKMLSKSMMTVTTLLQWPEPRVTGHRCVTLTSWHLGTAWHHQHYCHVSSRMKSDMDGLESSLDWAHDQASFHDFGQEVVLNNRWTRKILPPIIMLTSWFISSILAFSCIILLSRARCDMGLAKIVALATLQRHGTLVGVKIDCNEVL